MADERLEMITKHILLDIAEQQLAIYLLTETELAELISLAKKWGLIGEPGSG